MGKVILEKLLRTTEFAKLYILIRPSKTATADQRLNEIFISPIFAPLFKSNPEIASKIRKSVVAVAGDLMAPNLGISPDQRLELVRDLEIIINSAASVDFTEPIKRMIKIDYYGPISILELAHECKRQPVFSHISTAYVTSNQPKFSKI